MLLTVTPSLPSPTRRNPEGGAVGERKSWIWTWSQRLEYKWKAKSKGCESFSFCYTHLQVRLFGFRPPFLEAGREVGGSRLGALPSGVHPRGGGASGLLAMLVLQPSSGREFKTPMAVLLVSKSWATVPFTLHQVRNVISPLEQGPPSDGNPTGKRWGGSTLEDKMHVSGCVRYHPEAWNEEEVTGVAK